MIVATELSEPGAHKCGRGHKVACLGLALWLRLSFWLWPRLRVWLWWCLLIGLLSVQLGLWYVGKLARIPTSALTLGKEVANPPKGTGRTRSSSTRGLNLGFW